MSQPTYVIVNIDDVNEPPRIIFPGFFTPMLPLNLKTQIGTSLSRVTATDNDVVGTGFSTLTYIEYQIKDYSKYARSIMKAKR